MPEPQKPSRKIIIDFGRFAFSVDGRILFWIVPGYTHVVGSVN